MSTLPSDRRTIDELLAKARTRDRYAGYDLAGAEARLRSRQAARHRPRTPDAALVRAVWTTPRTTAPRTRTAPGGT
ncbi:hypothetical protein HEP87_45070 [Streptomyces sp. S1D4-11]|nr:hypothetical protein [Streptomyces sp. S1D4-11]QIY99751.1 hypothetical protein HEP87_45070 [Streptomyces sp. S1D4-11]